MGAWAILQAACGPRRQTASQTGQLGGEASQQLNQRKKGLPRQSPWAGGPHMCFLAALQVRNGDAGSKHLVMDHVARAAVHLLPPSLGTGSGGNGLSSSATLPHSRVLLRGVIQWET